MQRHFEAALSQIKPSVSEKDLEESSRFIELYGDGATHDLDEKDMDEEKPAAPAKTAAATKHSQTDSMAGSTAAAPPAARMQTRSRTKQLAAE